MYDVWCMMCDVQLFRLVFMVSRFVIEDTIQQAYENTLSLLIEQKDG